MVNFNAKDREGIIKRLKAQKDFQVSIADAETQYEKGNINASERNKIIAQAQERYDDIRGSIVLSAEAQEKVNKVLKASDKEMGKYAKSAKAASAGMERMDKVMGSFSGIPAMGELNAGHHQGGHTQHAKRNDDDCHHHLDEREAGLTCATCVAAWRTAALVGGRCHDSQAAVVALTV